MSLCDPRFDLNINVGHCEPYFMVQWFCRISWRPFDVWISYFGIMSRCDPTFVLKVNVGHHDPYCMVQWFCLIPWRSFDVWTSYFRINPSYAVCDLSRVWQYPPWLLFTTFVDSVGYPRYNLQKTCKQWRMRDQQFHWLWGWFPDLKIIFMM